MKKTLLLAIAAVSLFSSAVASNREVEWKNGDPFDIRVGHPSAVPTVTTDGDDVDIKCDSVIYNVDVVIRDQYGNVMHQSTQTIGPMGTTISLPDENDFSEKTTIELYYDSKQLSGYFDE